MKKRKKSSAPVILAILLLYSCAKVESLNDNVSSNTSNEKIESSTTDEDYSSESNSVEYSTLESQSTSSEKENSVSIDTIMDEPQFKKLCTEIKYNDIDKTWIGKCVTKEILFSQSEKSEYICASTDSYTEDFSGYQNVYAVYNIFDSRFDKSFPIHSGDVIRIYGIVTDVYMNGSNALYAPVIDMYYADYIRIWREPDSELKPIDELIVERAAERERLNAENEYYESLNSDYNGITKNINNMESLSETDFKSHCDSMNFSDLNFTTEDLSGRYAKIYVQLSEHKVFKSEDGKRSHLNDLVDIYNIDDNVWYSHQFSERADNYIGSQILLYLIDDSSYNISSFKKEQELIAYGMILDYKVHEGTYNTFNFLVMYVE